MIPETQKKILVGVLVFLLITTGVLFFGVIRLEQTAVTETPVTPTPEPETEISPTTTPSNIQRGSSPFAAHGRLHVSGSLLLDRYDEVIQLLGISSHNLSLHPEFLNEETLRYIRDEWGVNLIRLANYTEFFGSGYCDGGSKEEIHDIIENTVRIANRLGMYVILDWHTLTDGNPFNYLKESMDFFGRYASLYRNRDNIIYEICNEPNGDTTWDDIRYYADRIIPLIREQDPDAIILVAPAAYTTDLDSVAANPLPYENIMYTTHFYAGSHKQKNRDTVLRALDAGLPLFISECNITEASWENGKVDVEQGELWFDLIDSHELSYAVWSLSDVDEVFSFFRPGTEKRSRFTEEDLSEAGLWNVNHFIQRSSAS